MEQVTRGLTRAADCIANMVGREIGLVVDQSSLPETNGQNWRQFHSYCVLNQQFHGDIQGSIILLVPESVMKVLLADCCSYISKESDSYKTFKKEPLLELGSIIINACLREFLSAHQCKINTELPGVYHGDDVQVLKSLDVDGKPAEVIPIQFVVDGIHLDSFLVFRR